MSRRKTGQEKKARHVAIDRVATKAEKDAVALSQGINEAFHRIRALKAMLDELSRVIGEHEKRLAEAEKFLGVSSDA